MSVKKIVLGGGCFWCVEAVFLQLRGVLSVVSGYTGGRIANPSYERICSGATGHAEVIEVTYDNSIINLEDLLQVFFATHDPTTLNRQGNDIGTQYRSVIFYSSEDEKALAEKLIAELEQQGTYANPIVTQLEPLTAFYPAEDYHQNYFARNPANAYCQYAIPPKLNKLASKFSGLLKP